MKENFRRRINKNLLQRNNITMKSAIIAVIGIVVEKIAS
jgi:hypothetical protein